MLGELNSDLVLQIIQYLNVKNGNNLASISRRFYYLVHRFRIVRGPDLVAATSSCSDRINRRRKRNLNSGEMLSKAISKLQTSPNLALAFNTGRSALPDNICQSLPKSTIILGAVSSDIESNCDGEIGCKSNASIMLGNLPSATVKPFFLDNNISNSILHGQATSDTSTAETSELLQELARSNTSWKVFLVYGCGSRCMVLEDFIFQLQNQNPGAVIVGGICSSGYVSQELSRLRMTKEELSVQPGREIKYTIRMLGGKSNIQYTEKSELVDYAYKLMKESKYILTQADDAIFGVALGGDVPVHSIVSRGVRSVAPSSSTFVIQNAAFVSGNEGEGSETESPCHLIHSIRDEESGKSYSFMDLFTRLGDLDFIGLECPGRDGFELHPIYNLIADSLLIPENRLLKSATDHVAENGTDRPDSRQSQTSSLINKRIGFFSLDSDACIEHMDSAMNKLRQQTQQEEILGSIMFSCNGRDPAINGGLIPRAMKSDAARFAKVFPDVPCLGFYAGGEIGPIAMAAETDTCPVFQTGKVALQGFTVVFALFIVPVVNMSSYNLNDCEENVNKFIKSRLCNKTMAT